MLFEKLYSDLYSDSFSKQLWRFVSICVVVIWSYGFIFLKVSGQKVIGKLDYKKAKGLQFVYCKTLIALDLQFTNLPKFLRGLCISHSYGGDIWASNMSRYFSDRTLVIRKQFGLFRKTKTPGVSVWVVAAGGYKP